LKAIRYSNTGFTLIELMIVVVVVGVLTLVAYPTYNSFTVKANRAEAKSYLMHLAQRQQLYFNDSRTYAADVDTLKSPAPARVARNYDVEADDFMVIDAGPPPTFIITATPKLGTSQAGDGVLSIDNTGAKLHGSEPW
jgi:type IV pilus assembly protein PilE